jgi:Uma2 family endonuclease
MSTATLLPTSVPAPVRTPRGILLSGIRWKTYEALLADLEDRPIRLTYDRGNLEIMAPTFNHERCKRKVGRVVETVAERASVPFLSGGSTTFRLEDLEKGLEPDGCFYIQNVAAVLRKKRIDLRVDPPPDLAIEIDIYSSSVDRLGIYAALGVPELWRHDGEALTVHLLDSNGQYMSSQRSQTFPGLDLAGIADFLRENMSVDDGTFVRKMRQWLRKKNKKKRKGS